MGAWNFATIQVRLPLNLGSSASSGSGASSRRGGRLIGAGAAAPAGPFEVSAGGGEGALKAAF